MRTQAAVVRKKGFPFKFEEVEIDDPQEGELLIRMVASGVCHTDIAVQNGIWLQHFPCVLGHEGAGIVEKVGKGVSTIHPGDHVLLSFSSCGRCTACKSAHPTRCSKFDTLNLNWRREDGSPTFWDSKGKSIGGNFFGQSSFAYFALTHERNAIVIEATMEELALFAPLGCGIQAGAGTVLNELKPLKGENIAVFGVGAVGLSAVMAANLAKIETIIAIDTVPSRLELAKELGAHYILNSQERCFSKRLREIATSIDNIVETTGKSTLINQALECLSTQGKISLLAISADNLPIKKLGRKQTLIESIAGDSNPKEFIPFLISSYKKGLFPFDKLITAYLARDINKAIADASRGVTIKPLLLF